MKERTFVFAVLTVSRDLKSQNFAKKRGDLPVLNNVLLPRTRGFIATVQAMRGSHVKAVYDFTLVGCWLELLFKNSVILFVVHCLQAYYNTEKGFGVRPSLWRIHSHTLAGHYAAHVHVRRYLISDLPETDEELSKWVQARFVEKDATLEVLREDWEQGKEKLGARVQPGWRRPIFDFGIWDRELKAVEERKTQ